MIPKVLKHSSRQLYSMLYESCEKGDIDKLMYCAYAGLDLNRVDSQKRNPFYIACWNGKDKILAKLFELKIESNIDLELTPFLDSIIKNNHHNIVSELVKNNIDIESLYPDYNFLSVSFELNKTEICLALLKSKHVSVNDLCNYNYSTNNNNMFSPIYYAIKHINVDMVLGLKNAGLVMKDCSSNMSISSDQIHGFDDKSYHRNHFFSTALLSIFSQNLLEHYDQVTTDRFDCIKFEMNYRNFDKIKLLLLGNREEHSILSKLSLDIIREIMKYFKLKKMGIFSLKKYKKYKNIIIKQK